MTIQRYVKRLLDKIQNEEDILKNKYYIIKISNKCKSTNLFKNNIERFEAFKNELKKEARKIDKPAFIAAYIHFLNKILNAPTSFHMEYAPILTIPIIADFIEEELKN